MTRMFFVVALKIYLCNFNTYVFSSNDIINTFLTLVLMTFLIRLKLRVLL